MCLAAYLTRLAVSFLERNAPAQLDVAAGKITSDELRAIERVRNAMARYASCSGSMI
jgi:hypothetical protein